MFSDEQVTINGGSGADTLSGDVGNDVLSGDGGNDHVDGNIGADTIALGSGNDTAQWDPGDGSDTVEGEGGNDVLDFNGSNAGETIDLSANGARVRLFRNIASITQDLDGIERVDLATLGSADTVNVGDLTGTALKTADVNLAGFDGQGDGAADVVNAVGTEDTDDVTASSPAGGILVDGLAVETHVTGGESADAVNIDARGGDDTISGGVGLEGPVSVNAVGGAGVDTAVYKGTNAADTITVAPFPDKVVAVATGALFGAATESFSVESLGGADAIAGSTARCRRSSSRSTAGRATTRSVAPTSPSVCSAGAATTSSTATSAPTRRCSARAQTRSSGIPATAATRSRARAAVTSSTSTDRTPARTSTCLRTARACVCSATWPGSRRTSTASRVSTSRRWAVPTTSPSMTSPARRPRPST